MVTNGPKNLAVLTRGFFTRKCMAVFAMQPKKSGHNNEVTITKVTVRQGFTVVNIFMKYSVHSKT